MASFSTISSCNKFMIENCSSYEEFINAVLKKIHDEDDSLKTFEYVADTEAISAARELDDTRTKCGMKKAGESIDGLPLAGIPVAIKDIIDVAGMPTMFGCDAPIGYTATKDAAVVRQLKEKGAIIIGKVTTTELAGGRPTITLNPRDRSRTPGGSSAGSAASVAAGFAPLALGTQTGGSVIRPASFCGVFAVKPTFGLIDRFGVLIGCPNLDTVGFYSNDLADLADVICACTPLKKSCITETASLTVAVVRDPFITDTADKYMVDMVDKAAELMQTSGSIVVSDVNLTILEKLNTIRDGIGAYEWNKLYDSLCKTHPDKLSEGVLKQHRNGCNVSPLDYFALLSELRGLREDFNQLFCKYQCLMMPSAIGEALVGYSSTGNAKFNGPWTLLGFPVVNLPLSGGPNGMPLGLSLIGVSYSDMKLIDVASKIWGELEGKDITYV